jgi:MPBQ/MSBQ methyltransferase
MIAKTPHALPFALPAPLTAFIAANPIASPVIAAAAFVAVVLAIKYVLDKPSRAYNNNVGEEYDRWTEEGILEYYWGEHIHLGVYTPDELARGYLKKDFIAAKVDFCDDMLAFAGANAPKRILDVGCGIGGTSRHLAALFPDAEVVGITLSPNQVMRATELAKERGLSNVRFEVMNALEMTFPEGSFDLVWGCESGEHMPDKEAYVREMSKMCAPGGKVVVACWCQREETEANPLTEKDKSDLTFLYEEWAHPFFISKEEFGRLFGKAGLTSGLKVEDWTPQTIASWRHSIWVGVFDPWIVIWKGLTRGPWVWYMVVREIVTLERMHRAFARGLMEYGMITATKGEA